MKLTRTTEISPPRGGEVVYAAHVDGRRIGWVGDERAWRGHRFGGRRWWAAWREDGDTAARWNTGDHPLRTRAEAVAALTQAFISGT